MKLTKYAIAMMAVALVVSSSSGFVLNPTFADTGFVLNPTFDESIYEWYVSWYNNGSITPGTVEWDSLYGGSAKLAVNGSPNQICLIAHTIVDISQGDTIEAYINITNTHTQGSARLKVAGGTDPYGGQEVKTPSNTSGDYTLTLVTDKPYPKGSSIILGLITWPGSITCYVKGLDLHVGHVGVAEGHRWPHLPRAAAAGTPNPFRGTTALRFEVQTASRTRLSIANEAGEVVRQAELGRLEPGGRLWRWNGRDDGGRVLPAGTYLFTVETDEGTTSGKVVVAR